jgi:5'-nucleotidase
LPKQDQAEARARINAPGFFADIPVMAGAKDGLEHLAETFDVWIVSKPLDSSPTCRDEKARWLTQGLGLEWASQRLILAPDKSLIRGDILLDDAPKPHWFSDAEWTPVLYSHPWQRFSNLAGLAGWDWSRTTTDLISARATNAGTMY